MGEWSVTMKNPSKSMHASIVYGANIISNSQQMPKHIRVINQKTKSNFDATFLFLQYYILLFQQQHLSKGWREYKLLFFNYYDINLICFLHTDIQTFSVFLVLSFYIYNISMPLLHTQFQIIIKYYCLQLL